VKGGAIVDLTLFVDHQCNLRCDYCYTGEKFRRPMTEAMVEASVDLALSDSPRRIVLGFFGGEPLLHFPLVVRAVEIFRARLSRRVHPPELDIVLNTNATLIDERIVSWLVHENVGLNVSLDGPAAVHDRCRRDRGGRGSYQRVERGLRLLRAAGLRLRLNAVVAPETAADLGETASELFRHDPLVATLTPNLAANWTDQDLAAFRDGAHQAALVWESEIRARRARLFEPFLSKVLSHVQGGSPRAPRCGTTLKEVTVAPSGYLYSCAQQVGEDRDASLRIGDLKTGVELEAVNGLRARAAQVSKVCGGCALRSRCSADCGCKQRSASGSVGRIDGVLCATEAALVEAADAAAERLYRSGDSTFLEMIYTRRWQLRDGAELTQLRRSSSTAPPR
jgi:uncharacterized protein